MDRLAAAAVEARLAAAGCVAPDLEAGELLEAAPDDTTLEGWVCRREAGEPLAWIVGSAPFAGRRVAVDPGVFVPRPHTEELVRRAAALLPRRGVGVDLCTGSGAVAAALLAAVPGASVVGVDLDARAAACALRNGVPALVGDLDAPLRSGAADVVTAVAPYVPAGQLAALPADALRHEPALALGGGADGLDVVRRVVIGAARLLRPGGWLLVEVGGDQDEQLRPWLAASGFEAVTPWADDDGDLRGLAAQLGSPGEQVPTARR